MPASSYFKTILSMFITQVDSDFFPNAMVPSTMQGISHRVSGFDTLGKMILIHNI
jgi:hypothetical protein